MQAIVLSHPKQTSLAPQQEGVETRDYDTSYTSNHKGVFKMKKKLSEKLALSVGAIVLCLAPLSPAGAIQSEAHQETATLSPAQSNEYREVERFLARYGVSPEVQTRLIEKLDRGELWDSILGVTPTSEVRLNENEILSTYPDGSVAVFSIHDGSQDRFSGFRPSIVTQDVSKCSFSGSHYAMYWNNCLAKWSYSFTTYTLRFNYTHNQGGWRITDYWEPMFKSSNGNVSNTHVVRYSDTHVTYYADFSGKDGGSYRVKNDLKVHKSSAWTENG